MTTEIRKEIREYILNDVNLTLSRLGISEQVEETGERNDYGRMVYEFKSKAIKQFPMMFKKVIVKGTINTFKAKEGSENFNENSTSVVVWLEYSYELFNGGHNGCDIGRVFYLVDNDLPKNFREPQEDCLGGIDDPRSLYVYKVRGLNI